MAQKIGHSCTLLGCYKPAHFMWQKPLLALVSWQWRCVLDSNGEGRASFREGGGGFTTCCGILYTLFEPCLPFHVLRSSPSKWLMYIQGDPGVIRQPIRGQVDFFPYINIFTSLPLFNSFPVQFNCSPAISASSDMAACDNVVGIGASCTACCGTLQNVVL